jgi:hypothetical protein
LVISRDIGMVALGYGKYVRATEIVALIPIEDDERGDGRRTYVYVAGLDAPIVASRSERAILADMEHAPNLAPAVGGARRWRRPGAASANGRRHA